MNCIVYVISMYIIMSMLSLVNNLCAICACMHILYLVWCCPLKMTKWFISLHLGQHSLSKKPTNTADVAGSINITLECASTYGTDLILWTFTPLRSTTNATNYISSGYQVLHTYQQKYALNATVNSSVLVVRQLSSLTEGTYSCSDGEESASAFLLVIRMYHIICFHLFNHAHN